MKQKMSKYIEFRCPDDIVASIKATIEATGQDKTSVIVDMLRSSLPSLPINQRSSVPQESVIYFVWDVKRLLYIGKTKNLRSRISAHERLMQFLAIGDDVRIGWFGADEENLNSFELSLIHELEPELNGMSLPNNRLQFCLSFHNYGNLLEMVKEYCHRNRLTITEFAASAFEKALKVPLEESYNQNSHINSEHQKTCSLLAVQVFDKVNKIKSRKDLADNELLILNQEIKDCEDIISYLESIGYLRN